jgi:transposase
VANSKNAIGTLAIIILAAILLFVLNPSQADFAAHLAKSGADSVTKSGSSGGLGGVLKQGAAALASGVGSIASAAFRRADYLAFSTYSSPGSKGSVYLGIAKLFIKLK